MGAEGIHQLARANVIRGFERAWGRWPSTAEAQVVQGVGWLETRYGTAWRGNGIGSFNMGAIQCCRPKKGPGATLVCPANAFLYVDTHPLDNGRSEEYSVCFKSYLTEEDGFHDLVRTTYLIHGRESVLKAAQSGSVWKCSEKLRDTGYYEGFGATREERISNHAKALGSAVNRIATALSEPPMEKFNLEDWTEEQMLFDRVRFQMALALEYRHDDISEMARKAILAEAERDAFGW
jgi:hypothetical protein